MSSIHLADAANAVVAALTCQAGTYNVVDDQPVTARDSALAMGAALGAKPWLRGPGRLALLLGDRATSLTRSLRVSNARLLGDRHGGVVEWVSVQPAPDTRKRGPR
ncbi:hypothetical protein MMAN_30300 [Mycobacterium mantenii]|uniref:Uncharacterized protein n=1 Tax=Mycobacterium mantenii TaxID=560555 RepID=A0ABN6AB90_MYCNT|nr:hypothetical protein MMAN_30300 [Mycobacterium mantenii]